MLGNHFLTTLYYFENSLCARIVHTERELLSVVCKSLGLCLYRSCAWILMLYKPRYQTSVHLYCVYLFFPFLETSLQLIGRNEDTHLNSSPTVSSVQLYKFPTLHFLNSLRRWQSLQITMCKRKLWGLCNLQKVPKTCNWHTFLW